MRMSISTFGWATLVTHLDTIAGSLPTNSAKRLLVMFFSAKTTFKRFKRFLSTDYSLDSATKVHFFFQIRWNYS